MYYILIVVMIILPGVATAQTGSAQALLGGIGDFINGVLIPLLLGIAFLFFVINAVRFFVIGGSSDEGQESAKNLALYGIATFVFILSFWGIVNVLGSGLGTTGTDPCISNLYPDYFDRSAGAPCPRPTPAPITSTGTVTGSTGVGTSSGGGAVTAPAAYKPVTDAQAVIRAKAATYFASHDYQVLYGTNKTVVQNMLFADLSSASQSSSVTEAERVKAAYRLRQAGAITDTEYNTYFSAVNTYYTAMYQPQNKVNTPTTASITVAQPAVVIAGVNSSKAAIQSSLEAYNIMHASAPVNVTNTLTNLFNSAITTTARWTNFKTLYDSLDSPISDNAQFQTINTYRENLNTENAFKGNFTPIW